MGGIELNLTLHRDPAAARMARDALQPLRSELGDEQFSDLRVVVSELVANASLHGGGEDIRLALAVADRGIVCGRVEDDGASADIGPKPHAESVDDGLGLLIVDSLASRWGIDEGRGGVWFEIEPPADEVAAAATLREIGAELATLSASAYGESPRSAEVLVADDAIVVLLEGISLDPAATGDDGELEASLRAALERILGRSVISLSTFAAVDTSTV